MVREKAGALIVLINPVFQDQRSQIAELSAKLRPPAVAGDRTYSEAGVLMSYGSKIADQYRRVAAYVDKIFKGANPAVAAAAGRRDHPVIASPAGRRGGTIP